jgi:hypothetical protein
MGGWVDGYGWESGRVGEWEGVLSVMGVALRLARYTRLGDGGELGIEIGGRG